MPWCWNFKEGDILVAKYTIYEMLPVIKKCSAMVVEDSDMEGHACITAMALDIPIIIGADNASRILKHGAMATLDLDHGTVQYTTF